MKLFDGSGEHIRADDVRPGYLIRESGDFKRVETVRFVSGSVVLQFEDGHSSERLSRAARVLWKYDRPAPVGDSPREPETETAEDDRR